MTEADLIIMWTGLKRRGREYFKAQATKESQMIVGHKKYPISTSHYPGQSVPSNTSYLDIEGGDPPHANACGTQVQAAGQGAAL